MQGNDKKVPVIIKFLKLISLKIQKYFAFPIVNFLSSLDPLPCRILFWLKAIVDPNLTLPCSTSTMQD